MIPSSEYLSEVNNLLEKDYIIPLTAQPYFFNNESSPFPAPSNIKSLVSTIHGIDYSNTEGVINEVKVETKFNPTI